MIFGGAGSLGRTLTSRILEDAPQAQVVIFSRDEAKHFHMRNLFPHLKVQYHTGDIRDYNSVIDAIRKHQPTNIINAAALKQVPLCEEFPAEAVATNVQGTQNIVRAAHSLAHAAKGFNILSISTDKAVKPVNAYGATKMLQEKIHLNANYGFVKCNVVRYGNVLESTGSVIPFFRKLLSENKTLPVTDRNMTRFLLSLNEAVDLVFKAILSDENGKIFIPMIHSAYVYDIAELLCIRAGKDPDDAITLVGKRPGEKIHEILASEEEAERIEHLGSNHDGYFTIGTTKAINPMREDSFSSLHNLLSYGTLQQFLLEKGVIECKSESQAHRDSSAATL